MKKIIRQKHRLPNEPLFFWQLMEDNYEVCLFISDYNYKVLAIIADEFTARLFVKSLELLPLADIAKLKET